MKTWNDISLFGEAFEAGRDVLPFERAIVKWCSCLVNGKPTTKAITSAGVRWRELAEESQGDVNRCDDVFNAWLQAVDGPALTRRAKFLARTTGRTQRQLISHGGTHSVHWQAMRYRRLVALLGLDGAYQEKIKREAETAALRKQRAAERKAAKEVGVA